MPGAFIVGKENLEGHGKLEVGGSARYQARLYFLEKDTFGTSQ
jgi:hypothetical protein